MHLIGLKLLRDMRAVRGRVVTLILIIACGAGMLFGIETALGNLVRTQDSVMDQMHMADLEVQLLPQDVSNLPDLSRLEGVAALEQRLAMPGAMTLPNGRYLKGLVLFQQGNDPRVNERQILEGRTFREGEGEAVIDRALASHHGYRVGDRLKVKVGSKSFDWHISGIVMSPEFLVSSSNPDYVIVEPGSLGVIWTDIGQVTEALGFSMINSLLFRFEPGADPEVMTARVMDALHRESIEKVTPRAQGYSYQHVRMEVTAFGVYSPAIIVTLSLLSLGMGVITFRRFIVERQREFGVMAALGVGKGRLLASLLRLGALTGFLGGLLGLVIGWGLGWAFAEVYAHAMSLPLVVHQFDGRLAAWVLLLSTVNGALSLFGASYWLLQRSPRSLMLEAPTDPGIAGRLMGKIRGERLGMVMRHALRGLLRDYRLTLSSILAMAGAVAVAISYGLAMTSTLRTVENTFDREGWRYAIDFQYPMYADEVPEVLGQGEGVPVQPYFRTAADVRHEGAHAVGALVGQVGEAFLHVEKPAQGRAPVLDDEVLLSSDIVRALGLRLGATVEVGKGEVVRHLRVVGISNDIFLRTISTTLATAQALAQAEDKVTGLYAQDMPPEMLVRLRERTGHVANITDKLSVIEHFRKQMDDKMGIVYITILFSIGVAVLFVTTIVYLGIAERRRDYAILRSLGFAGDRIWRVILVGVFVQVLMALILSVPLSLMLAALLNQRMESAWFAVQMHAKAADFVWPMLAALVVAPLVGWFGARHILSLRISTYLRSHSI